MTTPTSGNPTDAPATSGPMDGAAAAGVAGEAGSGPGAPPTPYPQATSTPAGGVAAEPAGQLGGQGRRVAPGEGPATAAKRGWREVPPGDRARRRRARALGIGLLPLAAGALIALSLPPFGLWPLAIVGVAVLSRSLEVLRWHRRLLAGYLAGLGQFSVGLTWALQFNSAGYVALVVAESLFLAAACALTPPQRGRVPALVGLLTLAELARQSWPFGGLPLGGMALGQVGGPFLLTARLGGPLLVTAVTCLAGVGLGELARRPSLRSVPGAVALVATAGLAIGGALGPDGGAPVGHLRVAIVQGGGARGLDQLQVPPSVVFNRALAATESVKPPLSLLLWPEDVVSMGGPLVGSQTESTLQAIARRLHTTFVAGVTLPVGATQFDNEMVVFGPTGKLVTSFEKVHRVPFGEYVPFRSFFAHFANLNDIPRDAVPGTGSGMIATPAGRFAVLISYEVFFADRGRSGVRAGGELILVPTNTSSYSSSQAPTQEIAASQLQAVSEGRDLLQAAPTGFSAVIAEDGTVSDQTTLGARAVIATSVPLRTGVTPFEQWGDLPLLVLALLMMLAGWARAWPTDRPLRTITH
jgi:apolipoprotein N-acyltransferase